MWRVALETEASDMLDKTKSKSRDDVTMWVVLETPVIC